MVNVLDFLKAKKEKKKISMVTCYDHWSARLIEKTEIDCVLVGDSVAMVVHGYPSTVNATVEMLETHTAAVARGLKTKFIISDMPFLTFRKGVVSALDCVDRLMKAGAQAVKLEGIWGHEEAIDAIIRSGVPVMGHLGLTPQSIHQFGGFRVQGRNKEAAADLLAQAKKLQDLGCFSLVLECIPSGVAEEISSSLQIPTIGIGAGLDCDGQVLVLQDLLGMNFDFKPKFLRRFLSGESDLKEALNLYHQNVIKKTFPTAEESYEG
jgi:3-methyl-2-oxobutanoate hydroxymethyltransferase